MKNMRTYHLFCLVLALAGLLAGLPASAETRIFEKNTPYQYISVWDDKERGERYYRSSRHDLNQGGISLRNPDSLLFDYTRLCLVSLAFLDREPARVLFVGFGVGSMPRYMARSYPGTHIDGVELDPEVIAIARKYFFFRDSPNLTVHVQDGRTFVKRTKNTYDMIFLDAYQNDFIPFHLTTTEFLREVKSRLKPGGVVVSNVLAKDYNRFFDSMLATYRKEFSQVYVFKMKYSVNHIFVATLQPGTSDYRVLQARAQAIQRAHRFDYDLAGMIQWMGFSETYAVKGAKVLTDDFAPVAIYQHERSTRK